MHHLRFKDLTARYEKLRIAVIGDFCLDRYLEIDPGKPETSIETGVPVYNVINVRSQPGAAGTVLNNLVALGIGQIIPVGFCGEDGEGMELQRALQSLKNVDMAHFISTPLRRTFTYCKPLVLTPGEPPRELNRLDTKNWSPTPDSIVAKILKSLDTLKSRVDAMIVMDQAPVQDTGVVTSCVIPALAGLPGTIPIIADSRRSLRNYPSVIFKMNAFELGAMLCSNSAVTDPANLPTIEQNARHLAKQNSRPVFITMAERGIAAAEPGGVFEHVPALPVRGPIDPVGAGDCVTANLTAALASGATLGEAMEIAMAASSIVVHCLGTTGTASLPEIAALLP